MTLVVFTKMVSGKKRKKIAKSFFVKVILYGEYRFVIGKLDIFPFMVINTTCEIYGIKLITNNKF